MFHGESGGKFKRNGMRHSVVVRVEGTAGCECTGMRNGVCQGRVRAIAIIPLHLILVLSSCPFLKVQYHMVWLCMMQGQSACRTYILLMVCARSYF